MSSGRSSETRFIYCNTLNYRAINLLLALGPAAISHSPPREFRGQAALVLSCFTRTCLSWHLTSIALGFTAAGRWQRDLTLHVVFLRHSMSRRGAALALPGAATPPCDCPYGHVLTLADILHVEGLQSNISSLLH